MYDRKNVLLAGGTGLIGTPLLELLLDRGAFVRVAALDAGSRPPCPNVEYVEGDLTEKEFCLESTRDIDFVFHLASPKGSSHYAKTRPAFFYTTNILINTHLLEAARTNRVRRFLYTSTMHVYSDLEGRPTYVETDASMENCWGGPPSIPNHAAGLWAKRMGELHARACAVEYGWDEIAIVRPTVVYGPGDNFDSESALLIPTLIRLCVDGENPIELWNRNSGRDFLYASDVAEGMALALEKYCSCEPVNLGSGQMHTVEEVLATVLEATGHRAEIRYVDRQSPNRFTALDMERARSIGFEPKVSLREGIERTVGWYVGERARAGA